MRAHLRDEAAALHIWQQASGEPIGYGTVREHVCGCADCASANVTQVWFIVNGWNQSIASARARARARR